MSPKPITNSPQTCDNAVSGSTDAQQTADQSSMREDTPGDLNFPEWDILPPDMIINPRIRKT